MIVAALASAILLLQAPPSSAEDEGDWGIAAFLKSTAPAVAPTPAPAIVPRPPLVLQAGDGWSAPLAVDENDAARFTPGLPKPVEGNCRQDDSGFSCGSSETARNLAEDLAKRGQDPD